MKVPATARISPSRQGLGYLRAVTPDARGLIGAMGGFADATARYAARVEARQEDTDKVKALAAFSQFETDSALRSTELKRQAQPDGANFVPQLLSAQDTEQNKFIAGLPPELQDEFVTRATDVRGRMELDAYEFQFTQQDAFFKTNITGEYEKAKNALAQTPDQLDAWDARLAEMINAADVPVTLKAEWGRTFKNGLAAVAWGKSAEEIVREVASTSYADKVINVESGGRANARAAKGTAGGYGGFIKGTWRAFIAERHPDLLAQGDDIEKFKSNLELNKEAIEWYAEKNAQYLIAAGLPASDTNLYLGHHFDGPVAVKILQAPANTPIEDVVGSKVMEYNAYLKGKTTGELITLIGNKIGAGEAVADLNADPRFSGLTLEDKEGMLSDAERKVSAEETEQTKLLEAQLELQRNALYNGLLDGTQGQSAIDGAYKSGLLNDVDDREKAQAILKGKEEEIGGAAYVNGILAGNGFYNPVTDNDKGNKWYGTEGNNRVGAGDQKFIDEVLMPAFQQLGDVPTAFIGTLTGLTRGTPEQAEYAYRNLASLEDLAPEAYNARVGPDLASMVDVFRVMKNSTTPEEMDAFLRGGQTPAEKQGSVALDKEAASIVTGWGMGQIGQKAIKIDWGWNKASVGNYPTVQVEFEKEFVSAFKFYFRKFREENTAVDMAQQFIDRKWGPTAIGGSGRNLMRNPPNKIYFPKQEKERGWFGGMGEMEEAFDAQVRKDANLGDDRFELVSDEITEQEIVAYKQGKLNHLPSYSIVRYTDDGTPIPMDPVNQRWWGTPLEAE